MPSSCPTSSAYTTRTFRLAELADLETIMTVIGAAKKTMRAAGNFNQWIHGYPTESVIRNDIQLRGGALFFIRLL